MGGQRRNVICSVVCEIFEGLFAAPSIADIARNARTEVSFNGIENDDHRVCHVLSRVVTHYLNDGFYFAISHE